MGGDSRVTPLRGSARALAFINALTHTKGQHAGTGFGLRKWQARIVRELFKTRRGGLRQYRTCLLMLPRKNGKTELAAAMALFGLLADGEVGAEVYSAAADREQASLVFNVVAQMIRNDAELEDQCEIVDSQKRIVHRRSGSVYRAISADAHTKHGFNASMVIYDELHAAPNRELWDVLASSQGARQQPLMIAITTAGYDRHSILYELYQYACRIRDGVITDDTFLPVIYEAKPEDDWLDERVWRAANPALGDFRSLEEMRIAAKRAQDIPGQQNAFRRLYLNQWTEQANRWIDLATWDSPANVGTPVTADSLSGRTCYLGLDLSSTRDLSALVGVFPRSDADGDGYDVLPFFWVPADNLKQRVERDRVPYDVWQDDGKLMTTPGNVLDYERIRQQVLWCVEHFDVRELGYDPWNATQLIAQLEADGVVCAPVRQGFASMAAPTKELEKLILSGQLHHGGHPVLRWNAANAATEQDAAGNVKLSKKRSTEKIDGMVALAMAIDRASRYADDDGPKWFERHAVVTL